MPLDRISWAELPGAVRAAVTRRLGGGPCAVLDTAGGGNSAVAAVLSTASGPVFVKGLPYGHDQSGELDAEYRVNAYLPGCCPRVLWRLAAGGWALLAFEGIEGVHADFTPGSPDLEAVVRTLTTLSGIPAPPLPLLSAWDRWGYYCFEGDASLLRGGVLLHTDLAATNVLVGEGGAHVIDWSWAARGPSWIDPALWAVRLISDGGHTPAEAAGWAREVPAFRVADSRAVAVLSRAEAARWADLRADGVPGIEGVARGSRLWADYWAHASSVGFR